MKRYKKLAIILILVFAVMVGAVFWGGARNGQPEPQNTETPIYANVTNSPVKTFEDCKKVGGVLRTASTPHKCYYDGVVYYQVVKKGTEHLNPPENLKTFTQCLRDEGELNTTDQSCSSWAGATFRYEGPPVRTFEDCAEVMAGVLLSNPPQCYGPDGTHFTGPRA